MSSHHRKLHMRLARMLLLGTIVLGGCDRPVNPSSTSAPAVLNDNTVPKDNTAINERDRSPAAKTPIDQDENTADVTLTADIRKQILAQPDLSVNAQNAKVITSQGQVTLRGPVASQQEIDTIVQIAEQLAGAGKVHNHLELAP